MASVNTMVFVLPFNKHPNFRVIFFVGEPSVFLGVRTTMPFHSPHFLFLFLQNPNHPKLKYILSTTITINAYNAITSDIRKRYITIQKPTQEVNEDISLEESLYLLGSRPMRAPHLTKVV